MTALAAALGKDRAWFYMDEDDTPDLVGALGVAERSQLDRIEEQLAVVLARLDELDADAIERDEQTAAERDLPPGEGTAGTSRGPRRRGRAR